MMSSGQQKFFDDFSSIAKDALRLDEVEPNTFRCHHLWTPPSTHATYGGQLIANTVEAAYRTVNAATMFIHSLRITFIGMAISSGKGPVTYTVELLRDGKSFCIRHIKASQKGKIILLAVASFHQAESPGLKHELAVPHFSKRYRGSMADAFELRKSELHSLSVSRSSTSNLSSSSVPGDDAAAASVHFLNLGAGMNIDGMKSSNPQDVWMALTNLDVSLLATSSGIPTERIHLIIACWLSDFIVALACLLPHGLPIKQLRMIASLDHAIYFHNPQRLRVDKWFMYEVRSSWAGNNRGLNHGRMYGGDGRLWMSVAQETVVRMAAGFTSKL